MESKHASAIAYKLMDILLVLGCPHILQWDNGTEVATVVSNENKDMWKAIVTVHDKPHLLKARVQYNVLLLIQNIYLFQSVISYQQIDTPQSFSPVDTPAPVTSPPTTMASQQEHQQPADHPTLLMQSFNSKQTKKRT